MVTAIMLIATWVIAVIGILAFFKGASESRKIQEDESIKWARKWNEQRAKEASENHKWCDDFCLRCSENDWCIFSEVKE